MSEIKKSNTNKCKESQYNKNDNKKKEKNISYLNTNSDIPLLTKKKLHLRDLKRQQEKLGKEHITAKEILQKKQIYFSLSEKKKLEEQEKLIKEYEQAMKDNQDRQIMLEEKIKNKEKKIKAFDDEIKQYKTIIESLHKRIKTTTTEIETREKSLSFLTKFKTESIEFVQLDMFDRLETIFNSEILIRKKKEELNDKISCIKNDIKLLEEQNNIAIKNKENEYKNLIKSSEQVTKQKKMVEEKLKEHINIHNKKHLLLNKIMSSIDNFLSRFATFLPELRHYNAKKGEEKLVDKKNKSSDGFEDIQFFNAAELNDLEQNILKKLDIIYKYIKDITYIIDKAKKEIFLKDEIQLETIKTNMSENAEFFF